MLSSVELNTTWTTQTTVLSSSLLTPKSPHAKSQSFLLVSARELTQMPSYTHIHLSTYPQRAKPAFGSLICRAGLIKNVKYFYNALVCRLLYFVSPWL